MTRQEIRDMSRKKLGETTSAFWTDAELDTYINLGCKDVAWRAKCLRTSGSIVVSSCEAGTVSQKFAEFTISTYLHSTRPSIGFWIISIAKRPKSKASSNSILRIIFQRLSLETNSIPNSMAIS